jgi:hypothetical protein
MNPRSQIADSYLGIGKHNEAKQMLLDALDYDNVDNNIAMSATLRLLKVDRRLGDRSTLSEDWSKLEKAVKKFDAISNTLKYESLEETLCQLSILETKDVLQIPQVSQVVKILSRYRVDKYHGSPTSTLNISRNLEELERSKTKLNLYSFSGPRMYYCRKTSERFPSATLTIVEKVAGINWTRLKRIQEMRILPPEADQEPATKSTFQDSGLGSSIGSDPMDAALPQKAKSIRSISSFMS